MAQAAIGTSTARMRLFGLPLRRTRRALASDIGLPPTGSERAVLRAAQCRPRGPADAKFSGARCFWRQIYLTLDFLASDLAGAGLARLIRSASARSGGRTSRPEAASR